jgi:membrane protein YdbS with pleckstrin-like domain
MYDAIKSVLLWALRVPAEPTDPMGDVQSLRVFRASWNYYRYKLFVWGIWKTVGLIGSIAVAGFVGSVIFIGASGAFGPIAAMLLTVVLGIAFLVLKTMQVLISWMLLKLEYEMRWYKVSDRSLRIREGVVFVREMTMSFANIQNMTIEQGPLQRFFGIADLKVESAGGGGFSPEAAGAGAAATMHAAYFRGVEILFLMRERLKLIRSAGLGDRDDPETALRNGSGDQVVPSGGPEWTPNLFVLRDEVRRFRQALDGLRQRPILLPGNE